MQLKLFLHIYNASILNLFIYLFIYLFIASFTLLMSRVSRIRSTKIKNL